MAEGQPGILEQWDQFQRKYGPRVNEDGTLRPAFGSQVVLWSFVAINVLVWLVWQAARAVDLLAWIMELNFMVSVESLFHFRVWTLVTSAFSHISATHIAFNMLALILFGRDVAGVIGPLRFIGLYLVGAIFASLGHVAWQLISGLDSPALGASGSVMAVSMVYAALFPTRVIFVQGLIPLPAAAAAVVYVFMDLCGAVGGSGDGVAHAAHLGGAAYGVGYGLTIGRWRLWRMLQRSRSDA